MTRGYSKKVKKSVSELPEESHSQMRQSPVAKKRKVAKPKPLKVGGARRRRQCAPKPIQSDVVRQLCRLPAKACIPKSAADVMYVNSRFGRFIDGNTGREIVRRTRVRVPKKHKPQPKNKPKRETKKPSNPKRSSSSSLSDTDWIGFD
ncbi:uncharacterized protein [Drosophila bipectinata]|uniref:uncharacterized protein n=1 Tax=Drosophila bipectinata TaxID=42026 RepID=UPI0038B2FBD6